MATLPLKPTEPPPPAASDRVKLFQRLRNEGMSSLVLIHEDKASWFGRWEYTTFPKFQSQNPRETVELFNGQCWLWRQHHFKITPNALDSYWSVQLFTFRGTSFNLIIQFKRTPNTLASYWSLHSSRLEVYHLIESCKRVERSEQNT